MSQNSTTGTAEPDLDLEIDRLAQEIADLKQRHLNVQLAERERVVLERTRNELKSKGQNRPEIQQQLREIQQRLQELDLSLESRLFNEIEFFWQIVRYVGVGIVLGWLLCSWGK
jgi:DNA repair exonuclease SbcCD ATPase subunit